MSLTNGLKLAISGKGGVGKTTLSALLCELFARDGHVLAIDADPDANLGMALGFDADALQKVTAISEDKKLIKERTGAEAGVSGQMFSLNPQVEDIPEKYVIEKGNIHLMRMGKLTKAGAGCTCPENALLKHLLRHLVVQRNETVIVDMEAGLEHLGRGTAEGVDAFIVVVEPGQRSVETAKEVFRLARELGVGRVYAVVNKVSAGQREKVGQMLDFTEILGYLPYDPSVVDADLNGSSVSQLGEEFLGGVQEIYAKLVNELVHVELA